MKKIFQSGLFGVLLVLLFVTSVFSQSSITRSNNSISGFVFDSVSRNPLSDVYVELKNDLYGTLKRVKTDGTGRYSFTGLSSGTFIVKVTPYGTNYLEETQTASIVNNALGGAGGSDSVYLDIYLKLDKRKINNELYPADAVFVQDVPSGAKDLYKKAIAQLEDARQKNVGIENLKKSLEIFPNYFDALNRLGIEYVKQKQFYESLPFLVKAVQVNQRSFSSFYALGIAAYNLKRLKEATEAFRITTVINPQSAYAQFQYGRVLRISGNFKEAEQTLLKAKSLDKDFLIAEIYWQLGLLYEKTGRFDAAADALEIYVKTQSELPNIQQIKDLIVKLRQKSKK